MVEISGIGAYKTFSSGSEKSRRERVDGGAEFSELMHAGENVPPDARSSAPQGEDGGWRPDTGGMEFAVYDGSGKTLKAGMRAGRLLDVHF
jgi:hypothetical protein